MTSIDSVINVRYEKIIALFMLAMLVSPTFIVSGATVKPYKVEGSTLAVSVVQATNATVVAYKGTALSANVTVRNYEKITENLLEQLERNQERIEAFIEKLGDVEIPEDARESFSKGVNATEDAKGLFEDGDNEGAAEKAYEAMRYFADAFKKLQASLPEEPKEDVEVEAERARGLKVAIERAFEYLDRVNTTVQNLDEDIDISPVIEELKTAKMLLEQALGYLDEGEIDTAARALAAARETLGSANGLLNSMIKKQKENKAERFMVQLSANIRNINGTLDHLRERLEEGKTTSVKNVLNTTARKIESLRERLQEEGIDDLLDELKDAVDDIDDSLDELDDSNTAANLKEMNRIHSRVQVLNATALKLESKGLNNTKVKAEIGYTNSLLQWMRNRYEEGNIEEFEELIEEARKNYYDISDELPEPKVSDIKQRIREQLRNMLGTAVDSDDEGDTGDDDEDESIYIRRKVYGVIGEIAELAKKLTILDMKIRRLSYLDVNVSEVKVMADEARDLLKKAKELVEDDTEAAEALLETIEELLDGIENLLEDLGEELESSGTQSLTGESEKPSTNNTTGGLKPTTP
jgi:tetratricopeptide (TPR) repeat protein